MTAGQGAESRGTPPGEASRGDGLRSKRQAVCGGRRGKRSPGGVGFVCPQRTARVSGREERGQSREGPRPSRDAAHGHNHGRATPFPGRCPRPSQDAGHGHNRGRAHALPRGLLIPFPGCCPRPQSQEGHALPRTLPTAIMASRGSHRCSKRPSVPKTTVRQAQGGWGPRMGGGANSTKAGWCWDQHPSGLPTPTPWRDPAWGGGGCHSGGAPSWLWTGPCGLPVQAGLLQGRCLGVGSSF